MSKSDKVLQQQNKTNKRPFLCQKWIKYFLDQFYKIWTEGPFWTNFFLKMIVSTSWKRCCQGKNSISSVSWSKSQNKDQNRVHPLSLSAKFFPFLKGFKKHHRSTFYWFGETGTIFGKHLIVLARTGLVPEATLATLGTQNHWIWF